MARRPIFNGPFDMMDFPPYEFQEYPKAVRLSDGREVAAKDQKEELALLSRDQENAGPVAPHPAEAALVAMSDEKASLEAKMAEMQAKLDALMAKADKPEMVAQAKAPDEKAPVEKTNPLPGLTSKS